jgi:hypothetical protein
VRWPRPSVLSAPMSSGHIPPRLERARAESRGTEAPGWVHTLETQGYAWRPMLASVPPPLTGSTVAGSDGGAS